MVVVEEIKRDIGQIEAIDDPIIIINDKKQKIDTEEEREEYSQIFDY